MDAQQCQVTSAINSLFSRVQETEYDDIDVLGPKGETGDAGEAGLPGAPGPVGDSGTCNQMTIAFNILNFLTIIVLF